MDANNPKKEIDRLNIVKHSVPSEERIRYTIIKKFKI